jgi:hypothetical protein
MPTHEVFCKNQRCKKAYTVNEKETDDGFCSFMCWEDANCTDPENTGDVLETHVEEILKYG